MNKSIKTTAFTLAEGATHVETCDSSNKTAFTLAEGATHVETYDSSNKAAFTLAEVMIVVAIIGVVAAIIMPGFIQDMSERINSNRQANIAQKITKSVELMIVNGEYTGITTTEQFVDKLTKYLKITKRCDNEHLSDCWPTDTIKTAKGETYNISNASTSTALHVKGNTNTVGLILIDGASIILAYNPNATGINAESNFIPYKKALPIGKNKTEEFAYSSNATGAIDFVMDVNGKTGPNQEPDFDGNFFDIRSFRTAAFTRQVCAGGVVVEKTCIINLDMDYDPLDCTKSENSEYCDGSTNYSVDYWAGANKTCKELGLDLPDDVQTRTFSGGSLKAIPSDRKMLRGHSNIKYMSGLSSGGTYAYDVSRTTKNMLVCIGE